MLHRQLITNTRFRWSAGSSKRHSDVWQHRRVNSESLRIADQLNRAFSGDPWHGSPLSELLAGVTAEQALSRPIPSAHTIWELVLHIDVYVNAAMGAVHGTPMPQIYG